MKISLEEITRVNYFLVFLLFVFFISVTFISVKIYNSYPYCMDEYNYIYQAGIFARGELTEKVINFPIELIDKFFIRIGDRQFSKYPPFFSMILSIGVILGIPALVNPIISLLTLIFLYKLIRTFANSNISNCAVLLVASNPYFLGYSSSYFAQPLSLMLTVLGFFIAAKFSKFSIKYQYILGVVIGLHFWTRPLDALCSAVPCMFLIIRYNKDFSPIKRATSVIVFFITLFCAYNWYISGHFSISTYDILNLEFKLLHPESNNYIENINLISLEYLNGIFKDMLPLLKVQYFWYSGRILPIFALIGLLFNFRNRLVIAITIHTLMILILYNFHHTNGWPQYGARYYYPTWLGLSILTAICLRNFNTYMNVFLSIKKNRVIIPLIILCMVGYQIFLQFQKLHDYTNRFKFINWVEQDLILQCSPNTIVLLDNNSWFKVSKKLQFKNIDDFKRNGRGDNDYLFVTNENQLSKVSAAYPDKSTCLYMFSNVPNDWEM
jgi:hypothetical protein